MKVKKKHLKGQIADFPKHVVRAMCDEQVKQGNTFDPEVFTTYLDTNFDDGGFEWEETEQGVDFWEDVIIKRNFHLIPKPEKHPHAKKMKQYAKDAKTNLYPWKLWEFRDTGSYGSDYHDCTNHPSWHGKFKYRRKKEQPTTPEKKPTPYEIIKAMLDKGLPVWAGVSNDGEDIAKFEAKHILYYISSLSDEEDYEYPYLTGEGIEFKYAIPIDTATMQEITELPE